MTLVSVIVPTRNNEATLERCLRSIRGQLHRAVELIVVDNESIDQTCEIAERYADVVLRGGPERSAQANMGVAHAHGEYVLRLDADFVLDPAVLSECLEQCLHGADAVAVHNSPDVSISWIARVRKFEVDMYRGDLVHSSARFVRREAYLALGGLDEDLIAGEDYDFQNRLNAAGLGTRFIEAEALHIGEPRSLWPHLRKYFFYGADFVKFSRKHPNRPTGQLGMLRVTYVRHWRSFLRHPTMSCVFLVYTALKFAAGGLGFTYGFVRGRFFYLEVLRLGQ